MFEYRFSIYFEWQIALGIKYQYTQILIILPFITFHFATSRKARGTNLFELFKQQEFEEFDEEGEVSYNTRDEDEIFLTKQREQEEQEEHNLFKYLKQEEQ
jgi:hypothetical protein